MKLNSIRWRLPISYAAVAFLAALALGTVMLLVLGNYYAQQEIDYLEGNALSIQPEVEAVLTAQWPNISLKDQISGLSFLSQTRIQVLDANGTTLADSGAPSVDQMISLYGVDSGGVVISLPETEADIMTAPISSISATSAYFCMEGPQEPVTIDLTASYLNTTLYASASPYGYTLTDSAAMEEIILSKQEYRLPLSNNMGTLVLSEGPAYGADILHTVRGAWLISSAVAIVLAALAGLLASRQIISPVLQLTGASRKMESGDYSTRVKLPDNQPVREFQSLGHAFNSMAAQIESTISTLRAFVADAAHELHTPLTALHTNLELAQDETEPARRDLYLTRALEQTLRMENLVSGLLNLSRIEAIRPGMNLQSIYLDPLLKEVSQQFTCQLEIAGIKYELKLCDEPVQICGNPQQIRQILSNLIGNAIKFTPAGGAVTAELKMEEVMAVITISDSGIGIPAEDLPHIFDRFHRGRNASAFPGSGLGLAITRALVRANDGEISVHSLPEHGTTFTVRLPLNQSIIEGVADDGASCADRQRA